MQYYLIKNIENKLAAEGHKATCGAGRSMVQHTFRCRQTKPEINILFAVCRVLNWFERLWLILI